MPKSFDAAAHLALMQQNLELPIKAEWQAEVLRNLEASAAIADWVLDFPLDDRIEIANSFKP